MSYSLRRQPGKILFFSGLMLLAPLAQAAASAPSVFGIPIEFILFALTLLGVALESPLGRHLRREAPTAQVLAHRPPRQTDTVAPFDQLSNVLASPQGEG